MSLNSAHQGYEYQDLLTAYYILKNILKEEESKFVIDRKENKKDKFDDLKIITNDKIEKKQIKYSNNKSNKVLQKNKLSTTSYDLNIDGLFESWKSYSDEKTINLKLCLAWDKPEDELLDILIEDNTSLKSFPKTIVYNIDVDKIWPENSKPLNNWRRFRRKSQEIDRNLFKKFCEDLLIEVELPKASIDIYAPGKLEKYVLELIKKIGVGKYPNNHIQPEELILKLTHKIKKARANGEQLTTKDILYSAMHLKTDYGNIYQDFKIDNNINVKRNKVYKEFLQKIFDNNKTVLFGPPGSGKSWFVQNFMDLLNDENINFIKHYCYVDLNDENNAERIKTNVFYGNLINDIINNYPSLKSKKPTLYGSDLYELESLLQNIDEKLVLIIDGLDHINRICDLKSNLLSGDEVKIIEKIFEIDFPDNIKVLISTQPLKRKKFKKKGYNIENIPPWIESDILQLMNKFGVENSKLSTDLQLSEKLLEKSQGNPLYLSYLIKEVKEINILNKKSINELPDYSYNLSKYYKYLLTKLDERDDIVCTLSGVNFPITRSELQEITNYDDPYLGKSLNILKPVIKENYSTGGIVIYHESFRRYIIETLKEKGAPVRKKVYKDLIEWFETKDFFSYAKAFRNFLNILLEAGDYSKILSYLDKEYIVNSLFYGYPKDLIKKNYKIFLKASAYLKNFSSLVLLSEIGRILSSTEDQFEEIQELYFKALGEINGYNTLKELLVYEGKANLDTNSGLKVSYLCSKNEIVPEWDMYIPETKEAIELNEFKYFVRSSLDLNKKDKINGIIDKLEKEEYYQFRKIFIEEYIDYYSFEVLKQKILNTNNRIWTKHLREYEDSLQLDKDYEKISREILNIENVYEDKIILIENFFNQIDYFLKQDPDKVKEFKADISNINWFYNWITFVIETKTIEEEIETKEEFGEEIKKDIENNLVNIYSYLITNTSHSLGKPKIGDLYHIKSLIYKTIKEPLKNIKTKKGWNNILEIIKKMSRETMYSIKGSVAGPLPTNDLLQLLEEVADDKNYSKIIEIFNEVIEEEKKYSFYEYLTEYNLRLSIIYKKINKKGEALKKFREALKYHTSYTFRKDITLTELIDSINSVNNLKPSLGNKYIYKLKILSDTVVSHTDGRSTKYYPIRWYNELIKISLEDALLYIKTELLKYESKWVLENSLIKLMYLLEDNMPYKQMGETIHILKSFILKTFPAECDEEFLAAYKKNIKNLYPLNKGLAELSFYDLLNRLEFNKDLKVKDSIISFIENYKSKFNHNSTIDLKPRSRKKYNSFNDKWYEQFNKRINSRKDMSKMKLTELTQYFFRKKLKKKEINSLIYYLEKLENLNDEVKRFIDLLVSNDLSILEHKDHLENLKIVFKNMEVKDDMYSYANMSLYCYLDDGWYSKFTEKKLFKTSYNKNNKIALEAFFRHTYDRLKEPEYFRGVGSNIINALVEIEYDEEKIIDTWDKLYGIIDYRLSGQREYNWKKALKNNFNMNKEELLICILLTRLKHGEVKRQKWALSGIKYLLKNNKEKLIKPLKWFINNKDNFLEISFVLVLQLLWEHTIEVDREYGRLFSNGLKNIYPTENFMINYMIQEILDIYEEDEIAVTIDDNELEINEEKKKQFLKETPRNMFLNNQGFDMNSVIKNFIYDIKKDSFREKIGELYLNKSTKLILENMHFSNAMQININKLLQKHFNKNYLLNMYTSKELFYNINFDLKTIIAQHNSLITRPSGLKLPNQYSGREKLSNDIPKKETWIRLGYYEKQRVINKFDENPIKNNYLIFQGIVFNNKEKDFPYFKKPLNTKSIWEYHWDKGKAKKYNKKVVLAIADLYNDMFENLRVLWVSPNLLLALDIEMRSCEKGLRACNDNNEDVLIYNRWDTDYLGYKLYTDKIPQLEGSELLIREDYFKKICNLFEHNPNVLTIKK